MEKKIKFQNSLRQVENLLRDLAHNDGVLASTALYGFLSSAHIAVCLAEAHVNELDDTQLCNE